MSHDHAVRPLARRRSLRRTAFVATAHCLTGCAIGEVLGLVLATWWGWSTVPSIALAAALAYVFGYGLTLLPLARARLPLRAALAIAFAADTVSITVMEIVDNAAILLYPGAMDAGLGEGLFWGVLAAALALAFVAAYPVNLALIAWGKGHAGAHQGH